MTFKQWWYRLWKEEYILMITIAGEPVAEKTFKAKKILKHSPKVFIFMDHEDQRHEIRFKDPVDYHIIKVY